MRMAQFVVAVVFLVAGRCLASQEYSFTATLTTQERFVAVSLSTHPGHFDKEPDIPGHRLSRFSLPIANGRRMVGLLLDQDEGLLYVDLNADGDLTNDTGSPLTASNYGPARDQQRFGPLRLPIGSICGLDPDLVYWLSFYIVRSDKDTSTASAIPMSCHTGSVEINGKQFRFDLDDWNLDGRIDLDDMVRIRWPQAMDGDREDLAISARSILCLSGFTCRLDLTNWPTVRLMELQQPTGRLAIKGGHIESIRLSSSEVTLLWLDPCEGPISVPVGEYRLRDAVLAHGGKRVRAMDALYIKIAVEQGRDAELSIGTPLRHDVQVSRSGRVLRLQHRLCGQGGETYNLLQLIPSARAPTFKVYKGDKVVGAGQFGFG